VLVNTVGEERRRASQGCGQHVRIAVGQAHVLRPRQPGQRGDDLAQLLVVVVSSQLA